MKKEFSREEVLIRAISKANNDQLVSIKTIVGIHEKRGKLNITALKKVKDKIKEKELKNSGKDSQIPTL